MLKKLQVILNKINNLLVIEGSPTKRKPFRALIDVIKRSISDGKKTNTFFSNTNKLKGVNLSLGKWCKENNVKFITTH